MIVGILMNLIIWAGLSLDLCLGSPLKKINKFDSEEALNVILVFGLTTGSIGATLAPNASQ
ncbi:MAG: hypothetical protein Q8O37_15590 [Sulfuricellaceae bacterium]|nr:hypothetical protein [Sulfuricellaceae bacterium]